MTNTPTDRSDIQLPEMIGFVFIFLGLFVAISKIWRLPNEVILKPRRTKFFLALLLSLMLTSVFVWEVINGEFNDVFAALILVLVDIVLFVLLLPNASYLRLDPEGFTVCSLYSVSYARWQDVVDITVGQVGGVNNPLVSVPLVIASIFVNGVDPPKGRKGVVFNFSQSLKAQETVRKIVSSISGYEGGLIDNYGMKPEKLARLMNRFKARSEHRQQIIRPSAVRKKVPEPTSLFMVAVDLKESDFQRGNFWFRLEKRSTRLVLLLWPLLSLLLLTLVYLYKLQNPATVTFLIILATFPCLYLVMVWFQTKRGFRQLQDSQRKMQFGFSHDGYSVSCINSSSDIAWGAVLRAAESKHSFNLFFHPSFFHTIPKRCFDRPEDIARFKVFLKQVLGVKAAIL